jgi:hypothetical protein
MINLCRIHWTLSLVAAASGSMWLSGCGGGATAMTTVTYRPSRPDSVAESGAAAETGTSETTGGAAAPGGFGTLKGKIVYGGSFAPLPPLYGKGGASKDNEVCGLEAAPNEAVVVKDGGLANVFIWVDKIPKGVEIPPASSDPAIFDQKYCVFKPHAMIMRTGQTVKVLNSDPIAHNTHTKPERNNDFNQTVDQKGAEFRYGRPERKPVQVVCDIHPWMVAYHLPLDHPFAAVSGEDGTFEIPQLPSGKLELKLWHEVGKELEKAYKVEIKPGETTTVEITVPASKVSP